MTTQIRLYMLPVRFVATFHVLTGQYSSTVALRGILKYVRFGTGTSDDYDLYTILCYCMIPDFAVTQ